MNKTNTPIKPYKRMPEDEKRAKKMKNKINKSNYIKGSFGVFKKVYNEKILNTQPDYVSYVHDCNQHERNVNTEHISSKYWFTKFGIYRLSDHWGAVGCCFWEIKETSFLELAGNKKTKMILGYCKWSDLWPITTYIINPNYCIPTDDVELKELYKKYNSKYPILPKELIGKRNIAFEFGEINLATIPYLNRPLDNHPKHYTNIVSLIDGLDLNQFTEAEVYEFSLTLKIPKRLI